VRAGDGGMMVGMPRMKIGYAVEWWKVLGYMDGNDGRNAEDEDRLCSGMVESFGLYGWEWWKEISNLVCRLAIILRIN